MTIKYGRGKFNAHQNYIDYMSEIVTHKNYQGMPNAIDEKTGRINWQVSSGKTTSFYKYYLARLEWWSTKADTLEIPGSGNSSNRFSVTARLIHPTGMRPCRLCGNLLHVGYMYLNHLLAKRWGKITSKNDLFNKHDNVVNASIALIEIIGPEAFRKEILKLFPEKADQMPKQIEKADLSTFFIETSHIKTSYLSPGFMANPPDRLDGLHDYGICCRKKSDPGRSDTNMRTYNHDRRAFKWWAEGDWLVADSLYNKAGKGKCIRCGRQANKVSPDHIGPLACGFKHVPMFAALCSRCNSAKNRRFDLKDVKEIMVYEKKTNLSAASWQVKALWDESKTNIKNDSEAKKLGNLMRSLQDYYLRILHKLYERGMALPLSYLISSENAFYTATFEGLDPATLKYKSYTKTPLKSKGRSSLASRVVRIAFEELESYSSKKVAERKITKIYEEDWAKNLDAVIKTASIYEKDRKVKKWDSVIRSKELTIEEKESMISDLLAGSYQTSRSHYANLINILMIHFDEIGIKVAKLMASD